MLHLQGVLFQRADTNAGTDEAVWWWPEADPVDTEERNGLERENGEELSDGSPWKTWISHSVSLFYTEIF